MRKVKRWRYYCDFCKKAGGSGGHIATHEKHCTKNPDRDCRLECDTIDLPDLIEKYRKQLITKVDSLGFVDVVEMPDIKDIKNDTGNCPNCTLTILRCADLISSYRGNFDYKKELEGWWAEVNESERESDERLAMYGQ